MAHVLMVSSTYPRHSGDSRGSFIERFYRHMAKRHQVVMLVPDDAQLVEQRKSIETFRYFLKPLERLAYRNGMLANIKKEPWLVSLVPLFILFQVLAIHKRLRRDREITIVHAHWLFPQAFSAVLARMIFRHKVVLVCTAHGSDVFRLRTPLWTWMRQFVVRHSDCIIATANVAANELVAQGSPGSVVRVIPAGIDIREFPFESRAKMHRDAPKIVFVGRLMKEKGIWELVYAVSKLQRTIRRISLTIVGSGPEKKSLETYVHSQKLHDVIEIVGSVPNERVSWYYRQADFVVLPSESEGVPVVLMEAMASGAIVLAAAVGGIVDLIQEGETGFLCEPRDRNLADVLERLITLTPRDVLQCIRENAREKIVSGDYNLKNQVSTISEIYDSFSRQK